MPIDVLPLISKIGISPEAASLGLIVGLLVSLVCLYDWSNFDPHAVEDDDDYHPL